LKSDLEISVWESGRKLVLLPALGIRKKHIRIGNKFDWLEGVMGRGQHDAKLGVLVQILGL